MWGHYPEEDGHAQSATAFCVFRWDSAMTLYRDTTTGKIWTDGELTTSLAEEIEGLDDEDSLKQGVELRGDGAIHH
jgi:hypothetical protein